MGGMQLQVTTRAIYYSVCETFNLLSVRADCGGWIRLGNATGVLEESRAVSHGLSSFRKNGS
jgi:hypothetical protein